MVYYTRNYPFIKGYEVSVDLNKGYLERFYLTVTLLARLRGMSGLFCLSMAKWYAKSWTGIIFTIGDAFPASGTLIQ